MPRDRHIKEFENYVDRKYKLKVAEDMIDRVFTTRPQLYRSASTDALIRERDVVAFETSKPVKGHVKVRNQGFDVRTAKLQEHSV